MNKINTLLLHYFFLAVLISFFMGCDTVKKEKENFTVKVHLSGDIKTLNALLATTILESEVLDYNIHAPLLEQDPVTLEQRPMLAAKMPEIKKTAGGGMEITYEIRPEATWDNGTPILASDYVFTLKTIKNPKVDAASLLSYLSAINDVILDENNPRKFTVVFEKPYFIGEVVSGGLPIFPEYFYDENGFMAAFTVAELSDPTQRERLEQDSRIIEFANLFNQNFGTELSQIVGAGAYQIVENKTHEYITLQRKKNWWGDKIDVPYIKANPNKIIFRIIENDNTALTLMKDLKLDILTKINADKFLEMKENKLIQENYNLYIKNSFGYSYMGFNMKDEKLSDLKVRKALAHLVDQKRIAEQLENGLSNPIAGPVSPLKSYYDNDLKLVEYDLAKAKELLLAAGWADSDGDNILDKKIGGKKVPLAINISYLQSNSLFKNIATIMKDDAARIGVKINLDGIGRSPMIEKIQSRSFEILMLGWGGKAIDDDFTQVWHSSSIQNGGSNYIGFANAVVDSIIEQIPQTLDRKIRKELYHKFQQKIIEQQPYIFLVSSKTCVAVSKEIENVEVSSLPIGYMVRLAQKVEKK